jgi:DNA-binding XRE family transcriptional regulator
LVIVRAGDDRKAKHVLGKPVFSTLNWTRGIRYAIHPDNTLLGGDPMYSSQQRLSSTEVVELRKKAGLYLKELREKRGLSQRQMAEKVGGNYYTFISQLESGRGRIPPDRYLVWAEILDVKPEVFVKKLLRYYDPVTYSILFDPDDT